MTDFSSTEWVAFSFIGAGVLILLLAVTAIERVFPDVR